MRICYLLVLGVLVWTPVARASEPQPEEVEFFEQRIRPVLVQQCYECHNSAETTEAGLSLDYREALRRGGESGSVISDPPTDSLLLKVIRHEVDGVEMPEGGPKLNDQVIADFEKWMAMGAPIREMLHLRLRNSPRRPHGKRFAKRENSGGAFSRSCVRRFPKLTV